MTSTTTGTTGTQAQPHLLRRCPHQRMLAGVAAGIADYADLDVTTVRIALVVLGVVAGVAIPLYLAAWLLIPEEGSDRSIAEDLVARFSGEL